MSKRIDVFSGINSMGIPYTRDNLNHVGYADIIVNSLIQKGYTVTKINLSHIAQSRTFDLDKLFSKNPKYGTVRRNQYFCLVAFVRDNAYGGSLIPNEFLDNYTIDDELSEVYVRDHFVESENPIFLYAGGPNDFMTYVGTGPMELVNKEVRDRIPGNVEELLIKSIDCVETNWKMLISLNPKVRIYAYGFYYAPLFDAIQQEVYRQNKLVDPNRQYVNRLRQLVELFNSELQKRTEKYKNVQFIDLSDIENYVATGDFHPSFIGNQIIAQKTLEKIMEYENEIDNNWAK